MFAKFYPFKRRKNPESHIPNSDDYIYGSRTSSGLLRIEPPRLVVGTDREVFETISVDVGSQHQHPATIGSLNFEERLGFPEIARITQDFFAFAYAGIDPDEWLYHAVLHEKLLKVSGQRSSDVHFGLLNTIPSSGRVFVPYFRAADSYGYFLWAERVNFGLNLSSPYDPERRRVWIPRVYGSDTAEIVDLKKAIGLECRKGFQRGTLRDRNQVLDFLHSLGGVNGAEYAGKGVVLKHAELTKPIRLNAWVFAPDFDLERARERLRRQKRITAEKCEEEYQRIRKDREARHWALFGHPRLRWTRSRKVDQTESKYDYSNLLSTVGRAWRSILRADRNHECALRRIGATCDQLVGRVLRVREFAGDCFEETQPISGRRGGTEGAFDELKLGIESMRVGSSDARETIRVASGELAKPRTPSQCSGSIDPVVYSFHAAVHRLGGRFAGYPTSIAEVIRCVEEFFRRSTPPPRMAAWFRDASRLKLRPEVWKWLRFLDIVGCGDLEDFLDTARAIQSEHSTDRERLEGVEIDDDLTR